MSFILWKSIFPGMSMKKMPKNTIFLISLFLPQLISSGAFEISFNDIPIWSKLDTGRIPSPQELFNIIESHTRFSDDGAYTN